MRRKIQKTTPNPGSPEAIKLSCCCAVLDNEHGRGYMGMKGVFSMSAECPLHGAKIKEAEAKQHQRLLAKQAKDESLQKHRKEGGPCKEWKPRMSDEPPGLRKKMPAKERVIRAALKGYAYDELLLDIDSMRLVDIIAAAEHGEFGDTLCAFVALELNECLEEKWSLRKCADAAWAALEKGVEDLGRAASAVELLQVEKERKHVEHKG